ncbi:speract receptor-like [Paramacrobiotus metropolitanus]|uniref:speract receptor-like n=1 Tax=Paramacrobiotus metropolitanus TaxID=2943436 RepID=UPI0024463D64|nr:speract receptor-like [Paramacrobiotus metropolitanus]
MVPLGDLARETDVPLLARQPSCDASAFHVAAFLDPSIDIKWSKRLQEYDSAHGDVCAEPIQSQILARSLNMTSNEYVFIYPIPVQGPDSLPIQINANDKDSVELYKQVVTLNFPLPDYAARLSLGNAVARTAETLFHYNYSDDEKTNEITLSIPEMMITIGQVLSEFEDIGFPLSTQEFRKAFLKRRFQTNMRPVVMGGLGMRLVDSVFSRLNTTTQTFQAAWYFNFTLKTLTKTSALADDWNGAYAPPLNEPICGFRGDRCAETDNTIAIIAGSIGGIVVILIASLLGVFYYMKHSLTADRSNWWLLVPKVMAVSPSLGVQIMPLGHDSLWLRTEVIGISEEDILAMRPIRTVCSQIRHIHHENISHFRGIFLSTPKTTSIVWEGGQGTLRSFLSKEIIMCDAVIQLHFVCNVIQGLHYLHLQTSVRYHGSLSSLSVALDSRFTAKLCDAGSRKIYQILSKSSSFTLADQDVMLPPDRQTDGSQSKDIFALGIVMYEILKGMPVFPSSTINTSSVKHANADFQTASIDMIAKCIVADPARRPSIREVADRLNKFRPKGSVVANILHRLGKHAEHLEHIVSHRTQELLSEQHKVDLLLGEIIPPSIVTKLRNKVVIPPESFEAVTILFSSMVGFDLYCKARSPFEVGIFLNELYLFIDGYLASFDVYKVETIKDGYVVASGVPIRNEERHAKEIASFALLVLRNCTKDKLKNYLPIRIGIHTGTIAAGVVGSVMPRYCLFGDTMNTASRMESHGYESKIHISPSTKEFLTGDNRFNIESRGLITVKGKGMIETFWLNQGNTA